MNSAKIQIIILAFLPPSLKKRGGGGEFQCIKVVFLWSDNCKADGIRKTTFSSGPENLQEGWQNCFNKAAFRKI